MGDAPDHSGDPCRYCDGDWRLTAEGPADWADAVLHADDCPLLSEGDLW